MLVERVGGVIHLLWLCTRSARAGVLRSPLLPALPEAHARNKGTLFHFVWSRLAARPNATVLLRPPETGLISTRRLRKRS